MSAEVALGIGLAVSVLANGGLVWWAATERARAARSEARAKAAINGWDRAKAGMRKALDTLRSAPGAVPLPEPGDPDELEKLEAALDRLEEGRRRNPW